MRGGSVGRTRTTSGVDERLLDRLDPSRKLDRLSRFLWHRERLATLRGHWMYFYTDLKNRNGKRTCRRECQQWQNRTRAATFGSRRALRNGRSGRVDVRRLWQSINRPQIKLMPNRGGRSRSHHLIHQRSQMIQREARM